ncbi:uncharacterized protein LOC126761048 [Bactrocera neohumeralis]|uniref:uncharacterized protein LOC126761048 n=1 Tax=Bactrocera neohumeralis TaxID=98809 RepID=UPI002165F258|nr:uncharacterized protein LOC126761048 [Bactrocera neohumeralis]
MQRFICALFSVLALAHALPYGGSSSSSSSGGYGGSSSGGYGAPAAAPAPSYTSGDVIVSQEPAVLYNIPAPSAWNISPARAAGPVLTPVDARTISGSGTASSLIGISSRPSAIAAAASANVPLNAGSYKLLIVPSYEVPNIVGPEPAVPKSPAGVGAGGSGGQGYGGQGYSAPASQVVSY